ncbi:MULTISPECIES: hypothetical protein [unclassified Pseudomonas]|uniref:hypothetical protein n=1 Tax=unclassified Pseudomonas TaxID=196821 RepID=UPI000A1F11A8|nr:MULTISPECIES: hypothetical protein [unclassified Pseudomonas]
MSQETLSYVRALVHRAQNEGARRIELSLKDLEELLPHAEAGLRRERVATPMKTAGWVSPGALRRLNGKRKGDRAIKLLRFKTDEFNTEVFFCDNLREKEQEGIAAGQAREAAKAAQERESV